MIKATEIILKIQRFDKISRLNFEQFNGTIKCNESDTFNKKNHCFKNNAIFSAL